MADFVTSAKDKEYGNLGDKHEEAQIQYQESGSIQYTADSTHRQLRPRHIQLIGIGGTIGTALYVQIGRGLLNGGPASLFMAFTIWCVVIRGVCGQRQELATFCPHLYSLFLPQPNSFLMFKIS